MGLGIAFSSSYYFAICFVAISLMMFDVIYDLADRRFAIGILQIAICFAVVDLIVIGAYPAVFFDLAVFWSTLTVFPGVILASIIVYIFQTGRQFHWLTMVGFIIWLLCVAFANLYIVAHAAPDV